MTTFYDLDQEDIYRLYLKDKLEKYGAVKIYFGSRWNILISKPEFLSIIFKKEDIFAKAGNHLKIPYSVLAEYTGENVISAHGKIWKVFRNTVTRGLTVFDSEPLFKNAKIFTSLIYNKLEKTTATTTKDTSSSLSSSYINILDGVNITPQANIFMPELIQRLTLANISQIALGFDFGTLSQDNPPLHSQLKQVKAEIFQPLYLNFPFLDLLPIPNRIKARKNVLKFKQNVVNHVEKNLISNYNFEQTQFPSSDLIRAYRNDDITEKQLTDNMMIMLIAGHENPQLLLTTTLYLLAKYHSTWQTKLRAELFATDYYLLFNHDKKVSVLNSLPVLTTFIYESIRMYPPLSQIINRCTTQKCMLGPNIVIPANAYVGYNVYGTGRSPQAWGKDANDFKPERWGETIDDITSTWKHAKNSSIMSAFHGGRRACLGEKLAFLEVKVTLAELLRSFEWELSDDWVEKMTPAGPLCPSNLKLKFKSIYGE
ncbi:putative cytochrome P450 SCDLUD_002518 [Saccharomycodes ludwigii]|uniref:putative cytochrome P450 n=1 Tax=Saccharomycodes ludwigii TaxID=36035 RepID=UPI001E8B2B4D|nr:hypothetical protein SCDLUD_002518 [Saccharomycodes ludwigii]KAH3901044.1 hypothetical protein SCDLUD_002518 [Saccharomycodes ludwigii]